MRVLFVNNDAHSAADLQGEVSKYYLTDVAGSGEEGTYLSQVNDYAAIVVESDLPDMKNTEVCKYTREEDQETPILVLMDSDDIEERLASLDCGADAVLIKPVAASEVVAYLRNLIKRSCNFNG